MSPEPSPIRKRWTWVKHLFVDGTYERRVNVLQAMVYVAMGDNLARRTLPVILQTGSNAQILLQKKTG